MSNIYKDLSPEDVTIYRQWARDNHKAGGSIAQAWHPVVQAECLLIDYEGKSLISYNYATVMLDGRICLGIVKAGDLKQVLDTFGFYPADADAIKNMEVGDVILAMAETDGEVQRVIVRATWRAEVARRTFLHTSQYGVMNKENTPPRNISELWEDDPTFMDGGEEEILKLNVGETLFREDSSGYGNVTTRVS